MSDTRRLLESYATAVQFPGTSGFEVLELLDTRTSLAEREGELDPAARAVLEQADFLFIRNAPQLYESVLPLGEMAVLRRRAAPPCSHWWWYLEKLAEREPVKT